MIPGSVELTSPWMQSSQTSPRIFRKRRASFPARRGKSRSGLRNDRINMAFENYYSMLRVEREATPAEIRKSFRSLVLKLHPDKNPGNEDAEREFKKILSAYQLLSDPKKRAEYDTRLKAFEEAV